MNRAAAGALCAMCAACSYLPAQREKEQAQAVLSSADQVALVTLGCGNRVLAGDQLCAEVIMDDGARIHFSRLGFKSFGPTAVNIVVDQAGSLTPRIASCQGVGSPNFHRDGVLGHRFRPSFIDVKEAVSRYREIVKEVQYWPQCPQFWEVQDRRGANYRYCMRRAGATDEPPRPAGC